MKEFICPIRSPKCDKCYHKLRHRYLHACGENTCIKVIDKRNVSGCACVRIGDDFLSKEEVEL